MWHSHRNAIPSYNLAKTQFSQSSVHDPFGFYSVISLAKYDFASQ